MAQTSITLTASMRSNLSSLKSIQSQMDKTQERLSTGKKVNSAIDNASSYYQSRALTNRASDLESLLDSMGQGIQTIQAANEGLEAITSYVEQLKSVANSALALDPNAASYATDLAEYEDQYNTILKEISTLAQDSSYQGVNLLKGSELTVMFNESRSHSLNIKSDDVIEQMGIKGAAGFAWGTDAVTNETIGNISWTEGADEPTFHAQSVTAMTAVDTITGQDKLDAADKTNLYAFKDGAWAKVEADATYDGDATYATAGAVSTEYVEEEQDSTAAKMYGTMEAEAKYMDNTGTLPTVPDAREAIDASLDAISDVTAYLRSYATKLGNNYTIIETRQDFTDALVDVLETGSDNLVLADMNEESANYLALQTRQQLAVNSLALASQSAQSVLSLF